MDYSKMLKLLLIAIFLLPISSQAEQEKNKEESGAYQVQPGDVLEISVWKEQELQKEVIIRPDGGMSFPLAGDFRAQGMSLMQIQHILTERLDKYIPDPVVTVAALKLLGNKIYVLGKVNKPGEYAAASYLDVMQALAMAGGTTPFAAINDIKILRRNAQGIEQAVTFRYGDVESGEKLKQNIMLQSGDVIVVP